LKNKKKREAKKAKEAEAKALGLTAADGPSASGENRSPERRDRREHQRSRSKGQQDIRTPSQQRERRHTNQGRHNGYNGTPSAPMANLSIATPPVQQPRAQDPPELSVTSPSGGSPNAKKLRGLQKKIRAIEDLEMRLASGEKLEDTQMKKIGTKAAVQSELNAIEHEG
jgi:translation initiation factor 2A